MTVVWSGCGERRPAFHGTAYEPPAAAPAIRIPDASGGTFDLTAQKGNAVLLFFGYTNCPDVCPLTLENWTKVKRALGSAADKVRFVMVSVDPARDTPAVIRDYVHRFDPDFVGLSPSPTLLPSLEQAYGVASVPEPAAGDSAAGSIMHSARIFLIDPQGRLRVTYPSDAAAEEIAEDVRELTG